ncbi:MAG: NAD(P)-dependent oxidoreductase [Acidobacteriota bacterium]
MLEHHDQAPTPPERVVVLGARGFVASNVVGSLDSAGVRVMGLPSAEVDLTSPSSVDALRSRLRGDDAVVFVSALTPDRGRTVATFMQNLRMGQHVSEALAARPCAHVVYISSDAVYDDEANPVHERSVCEPSSLHGLMHVVRERMLLETTRQSGTPLAILRPTLLYGARDTHNGYGPNRFVQQALAGAPIQLFGGGEERRDHVLVDDVSRLVSLVLAHRSEGVLNIVTGTSVPFARVAEIVVELTGQPVAIQASPRANPITHRHFDVSATIAAFPSFACTPLRAGLMSMIEASLRAS